MPENQAKNRTIAYIDGFNLYYGLRDKQWSRFYWLDPAKLSESLLSGGRCLVSTKYFTARVRLPAEKRARQAKYLDAINASSDAEIILGRFYQKQKSCRKCNHTWTTHEEKMTDSAIAAHLVADAFLSNFDTAILVGGDTDIVPAIKLVKKHFPTKRIEVWFPPRRKNQHVADVCHDDGSINGNHLQHSLLPDSIKLENGYVIERPPEWS